MNDRIESPHYVSYTRTEMVQTLVIGAIVGVVVWGLTLLLNKYAFGPLMCRSGIAGKCSDSYSYALITSQVVAGIIGLIMLVRRRIFRPLLVVLGVMITLWGSLNILSDWTWYGAALASLVLYAIAYLVFMLLARIRMLLLSVVAIVVLLAITRFVLNA